MMKTTLPRMPRTLPNDYDPGRRLLAAVVVCAVRDHITPGADVTTDEQMSARLFLYQNLDLVADLAGVRPKQVKTMLDTVPTAPVQLPLFAEI